MTKYIYDGKRKLAIRNEMFQYLKGENLVGLAGPDILGYINSMNNRGFKHLHMFENNPDIAFIQCSNIGLEVPTNEWEYKILAVKCQWKFGDILEAEFKPNTVYDLDFTFTMKSAEKYVKKFKENFIFTTTTRKFGIARTLNCFFTWRKETISTVTHCEDRHRSIIKTDVGTYLVYRYRDTAPMLSIIKMP